MVLKLKQVDPMNLRVNPKGDLVITDGASEYEVLKYSWTCRDILDLFWHKDTNFTWGYIHYVLAGHGAYEVPEDVALRVRPDLMKLLGVAKVG